MGSIAAPPTLRKVCVRMMDITLVSTNTDAFTNALLGEYRAFIRECLDGSDFVDLADTLGDDAVIALNNSVGFNKRSLLLALFPMFTPKA